MTKGIPGRLLRAVQASQTGVHAVLRPRAERRLVAEEVPGEHLDLRVPPGDGVRVLEVPGLPRLAHTDAEQEVWAGAVPVLAQVEGLGGEEPEQRAEVVQGHRGAGVVGRLVRRLVDSAARGVRVMRVGVEVARGAGSLQGAREPLRARPVHVVEAHRPRGPGDDAHACVHTGHSLVERLEHAQVGVDAVQRVTRGPLRIEEHPQVRLVPDLDRPHLAGVPAGEVLREVRERRQGLPGDGVEGLRALRVPARRARPPGPVHGPGWGGRNGEHDAHSGRPERGDEGVEGGEPLLRVVAPGRLQLGPGRLQPDPVAAEAAADLPRQRADEHRVEPLRLRRDHGDAFGHPCRGGRRPCAGREQGHQGERRQRRRPAEAHRHSLCQRGAHHPSLPRPVHGGFAAVRALLLLLPRPAPEGPVSAPHTQSGARSGQSP